MGGREGGKEVYLVDGHKIPHGVRTVSVDDVHQHAASLHMSVVVRIDEMIKMMMRREGGGKSGT